MAAPDLKDMLARGQCAAKANDGESPHAGWLDYRSFMEFASSLGLRNFAPDEMLFLGEMNKRGRCRSLNHYPPMNLWPNIIRPVRMLDRLSQESGCQVFILSAYRSIAYNGCIDGAAIDSPHTRYQAIDFFCDGGTPAGWGEMLRGYRAQGSFAGGIGVYDLFVHVDAAGLNRDW
jgi:hypothetical protein